MSSLPSPENALVVRLVYDGPPRSGKTTSLRALAGSLSQPHVSPEEADGRTLYFDWVEYTGGSFEGMPIRCQIVSVPGQRELARRREALLSSADAVIFVADTTDAGITEATESMGSLRAFLAGRPGPRPGLIVQANKRDQPDALPLDILRVCLAGNDLDGQSANDVNGTAIIESVATKGQGIREAFVFAVRLALDRVRARLTSGDLEMDWLATETPEQLLARLKAIDAGSPLEETARPTEEPPAVTFLREVLAGEDVPRTASPDPADSRAAEVSLPDSTLPPHMPQSDVPSGRVWPPVSGRVCLHEAPTGTAEPRQGPDGSWRLQMESWFFHSAPEHHFPDLETGRQELLRWARLHSGSLGLLSPRRCIVLSQSGWGSWRLWQLIHHEPSLRQQLRTALAGSDPVALAETLLACATDLAAAREILAQSPPLPCRLELLGRVQSSIVYVGILPPPSWSPPAEELGDDALSLLRRELVPILQKGLEASHLDVSRVLAALGEPSPRPGHTVRPDLLEALSEMLSGQEQRA